MSRWDAQLEGHNIWNTLVQINGGLDVEFEDINEELVVEKRRLTELTRTVTAIVEDVDAEKLSFAKLGSGPIKRIP